MKAIRPPPNPPQQATAPNEALDDIADLGSASEATEGVVSGLLEEPANYRPDLSRS